MKTPDEIGKIITLKLCQNMTTFQVRDEIAAAIQHERDELKIASHAAADLQVEYDMLKAEFERQVDEARAVIEGLLDACLGLSNQQAMPDDFYLPFTRRGEAWLAAHPKGETK